MIHQISIHVISIHGLCLKFITLSCQLTFCQPSFPAENTMEFVAPILDQKGVRTRGVSYLNFWKPPFGYIFLMTSHDVSIIILIMIFQYSFHDYETMTIVLVNVSFVDGPKGCFITCVETSFFHQPPNELKRFKGNFLPIPVGGNLHLTSRRLIHPSWMV